MMAVTRVFLRKIIARKSIIHTLIFMDAIHYNRTDEEYAREVSCIEG